MNEHTRYRLTGAIFLLSIGIIVLPMIFDGEGVRVKQLPALTEPLPDTPTEAELAALMIPEPEIQQHRAEQRQIGGLLDSDGYHSEDNTRLGDPLLRELDSDENQNSKTNSPPDLPSPDLPPPAVARSTSAAKPAPGAKSTASESPAAAANHLSKTSPVAYGAAPKRRAPPVVEARSHSSRSLAKQAIWAVQLASFASPINATALRDRLLGDGFDAWTSTARREAGVRTRVAIGPLLDRKDAERMRVLVSDRYNVSAIVVHMEP